MTKLKNRVLVGVAIIFYATAVWPQIVSPTPEKKEIRCGHTILNKDVLVLDLEPFGTDAERADEFIRKLVQELEIRSEEVETIRTRLRSARKNRMSAMKRARTEAARRGCNVVLVLAAWAGAESAAYSQALPGGQQSIAVGLHYAYAKIQMASGKH